MTARRRRRRNASPVDVVFGLENLAILGAVAYAIYWIGSGKAKAFLCPGGGGICAFWPTQTTMHNPLPSVGSGVTHATAPWIPIGDLVAMTSTGPVTYGPNGVVPGTGGQTVNDLRASGYSDNEIASLIEQGGFTADVGPGPAGGAGGSW